MNCKIAMCFKSVTFTPLSAQHSVRTSLHLFATSYVQVTSYSTARKSGSLVHYAMPSHRSFAVMTVPPLNPTLNRHNNSCIPPGLLHSLTPHLCLPTPDIGILYFFLRYSSPRNNYNIS